jgi:hypothetical protein
MGSWVDEETAACGLGDARLNTQLGVMLAAMGAHRAERAIGREDVAHQGCLCQFGHRVPASVR